MQKLKSFFLSLFFFVAWCVFGLGIGVGIGYGILMLDANGMFSSWKSFDSNQQFEKIISANPQKVWAQATDKKVYSWSTNCYEENCNKWVETDQAPKVVYETEKLEVSASCKSDNALQRDPPGNVVECAHVKVIGAEFILETYYVLLDNGKIWMWENDNYGFDFMIAPFICGPLGFFAGLIGFVLFMIRRERKNKQSTVSPV